MGSWIKDGVMLGAALWLMGYLVSIPLFFVMETDLMGWLLTAVFTPITLVIAWWWFRGRDLPLPYYAGIGATWAGVAVVLDYLFIVRLFRADYYAPDVVVYYVLTFLIPIFIGLYLRHEDRGSRS